MYLNTNYQASGAGALVNYIEQGAQLQNTVGREISQSERERFIKKSQEHNFEREIRISPDPEADVSQQELERETQRYLRDFTRERPSARAIYAYHEDNGIPHVHAALTGERADLYMEQREIERDRQRLTQTIERDQSLDQRQEQRLEQTQEQRLEQTQEQDQRLEFEWQLQQDIAREQKLEQEQEQEQTQEQSQSQSQSMW
jgi:5'-3' exonuclease